MEGAVVSGPVTEIEGQELFLFAERDVHVEAEVLQVESALREPLMLGHAFHQYVLGHSGWLVFFVELRGEFDEAVHVFPGEDCEMAGETVAEVVLRGRGFAFGGAGAGRALGVCAVNGSSVDGGVVRALELGFGSGRSGDGFGSLVGKSAGRVGGRRGGGEWLVGLCFVGGLAGLMFGLAALLAGSHFVRISLKCKSASSARFDGSMSGGKNELPKGSGGVMLLWAWKKKFLGNL